jgi:hypothetical protein
VRGLFEANGLGLWRVGLEEIGLARIFGELFEGEDDVFAGI